jgi:uncharacterized membrane protein YphA (DoxX/SURF4 family)
MAAALQTADRRATRFMARRGPDVLRVALAVVFVWFGALKLLGASPVAKLVADTLPWFPPAILVPALGAFEMLLGAMLLWGRFLRVTLALFWLQLAGTFLVLVVQPHLAFQGGNPLLLTTEGEFVVKNLVLAAAGLVLGGTLRGKPLDA